MEGKKRMSWKEAGKGTKEGKRGRERDGHVRDKGKKMRRQRKKELKESKGKDRKRDMRK